MHASIMKVDPNGRHHNYSKIPSVWLNSKVVSHEKHALCSAFHLRWRGGCILVGRQRERNDLLLIINEFSSKLKKGLFYIIFECAM